MRPMSHLGRFVTALALGLILATAGAAVYVLRAATTIPASDVARAAQAHTTAKQVRPTANPAHEATTASAAQRLP